MIRNKDQTGVTCLQDIKDRCVIDDEAGCWIWSGAKTLSRGRKATGLRFSTPVCSVPKSITGKDKHSTMPALRFAWLLAGGELIPGQIIYRALCAEPNCVNPDHAAQATRRNVGKRVAKSNRLKGDPLRQKVNLASAIKSAMPVDAVREIEASYAEGLTQGQVRERHGLGQKAAKAIRIGMHINSSARQLVVPGASVFTWRP